MKQERGFSLIEIMVVVAIIGVLYTIVSPNIFRVRTTARVNQLRANLGVIRRAIAVESSINGEFPPWVDVRESNIPGTFTGAQDCGILRSGNMPDNPFSTSNKWGSADTDIVYNTFGASGSLVWGGGLGWCYNSLTGEFWANTDTPGINENTF